MVRSRRGGKTVLELRYAQFVPSAHFGLYALPAISARCYTMSSYVMRALAQALHPRSSVWKAMAMLRAYFDESGLHQSPPVTVIAGYVGTESSWSSVEDRWVSVLGEFRDKGIASFHATDCIGQRKKFAALDKPMVNYVLTQLSGALGSANLLAIHSTVDNAAWARVTPGHSAFLDVYSSPLVLCFDDVVRELMRWALVHAGGELVVPMFAINKEHLDSMKRVGAAYSSRESYRNVLGSLAFDWADRVVGLQAADFLAHERAIDAVVSESGLVGPRKVYSVANPNGVHGHHFDDESLVRVIENFEVSGEIYPLSTPLNR